MIKDKKIIKEKLVEKVLAGYNPYYDYESACDHGVDWTELTKDEFDQISKEARARREKQNNLHDYGIENNKEFNLINLIDNLKKRHLNKNINNEKILESIKGSLSIERLINNLSEAIPLSTKQVEKDLEDFGFRDLIYQYQSKVDKKSGTSEEQNSISLCDNSDKLNLFPELFNVRSKPEFDSIPISQNQEELFSKLVETKISSFKKDPFIKLYRKDVTEYFNNFLSKEASIIDDEIKRTFKGDYPKYLATIGIGANEQFTHFVASLNNSNKEKKLTWLVINSPKNLSQLPSDANINNTLFMEFSRSSLTEETVKIHEYTPRKAHRIIFSNSGPLYDLGKRDNNLVLSFPSEISGRFGRNKTPMLLAPMYVAGMDVNSYWNDIELAINTFDINDPKSLPNVMAQFIYLNQENGKRNLIYLGCNDNRLDALNDEFIQFWNEGVNKDSNDLLMSSFFGLPRDSHMNIEGILGNYNTKMGIFMLRSNMRPNSLHPMVSPKIDPINENHHGLNFGDEEAVLAFANYYRFSELMPSILITISGAPNLRHSAILGQLFADITFVYSRLKGIDPGSNPEVKAVRERSGEILSKIADKMKKNIPIEKAINDLLK